MFSVVKDVLTSNKEVSMSFLLGSEWSPDVAENNFIFDDLKNKKRK